jgi:hypothetical protein
MLIPTPGEPTDMGNTNDGSGWNDILQYSFMKVFADDEVIDAAELAMLQKLALADGVVDAQERMVLAQVFARVEAIDLEPAVRDEIARFRAEHGIG